MSNRERQPEPVPETGAKKEGYRNSAAAEPADEEALAKKRQEERIREERVVYARLYALTGNFICVYVVDPETDNYREFSSTDDYAESFAQAKAGTDFFEKVRKEAMQYTFQEDLDRFLSSFTKERVYWRRSGKKAILR